MCVEGDDDDSNKLVESFNDAAVSQLIVEANCVALLLPVQRWANNFLLDLDCTVLMFVMWLIFDADAKWW